MGDVTFSDLVDGVVHTAAHHNTRFNALKERVNDLESDNYGAGSVIATAIATAVKDTWPPVGSITAFYPALSGVPALPGSWMLCDGSEITDASSPMYGETLPDLNADGRFLKGADTSGVENAASAITGSSGDSNVVHSTKVTTSGVDGTRGFDDEVNQHAHAAGTYATGNPINFTVCWIIRIK